MSRYFFRLDDIAPNMNWDNFNLVVDIFNKYNIKPLLAVIPNIHDSELEAKYSSVPKFWQAVKDLKDKGWLIAQHGYQHLYKTREGGLLRIHNKSEFAGLDFEIQRQMLESGKKILEEKLGEINIFVAPAHSFDKNTIRALLTNNIKILSDGIALWPFKKYGIIWLPQITWRPRRFPLGFLTFTLHTNTMNSADFDNLNKFIIKNQNHIGNFSELAEWYEKSNIFMRFFNLLIRGVLPFIWRIALELRR